MEDELLQYLQIGGNGGVAVLIYLLWKIDRRLLALELRFGILPTVGKPYAVTDNN